jgi:hypothetical protein
VKRVVAPRDNFIGKELTPSKIACQFLIEGGKKTKFECPPLIFDM